MSDQIETSYSQSHFVPCVLKTLEILDALRYSHPGLRIDDLRAISGASRSTTYRIVRSLMHGGYVSRDTWSRYHLNTGIVRYAQDIAATPDANRANSSEAAPEFERWGVRFRTGKSRVTAAHPYSASA